MTDHAGPRRCECNPETKFWHPPRRSNQFLAPEEEFWRLPGDTRTAAAGAGLVSLMLM